MSRSQVVDKVPAKRQGVLGFVQVCFSSDCLSAPPSPVLMLCCHISLALEPWFFLPPAAPPIVLLVAWTLLKLDLHGYHPDLFQKTPMRLRLFQPGQGDFLPRYYLKVLPTWALIRSATCCSCCCCLFLMFNSLSARSSCLCCASN